MKTILHIIILIFSFLSSTYSQQIEFFNVGSQDRPLLNIIISKQKTHEGDFVKNIVVSDTIYVTIKQYVIENNTRRKPVSRAYKKEKDFCFGNYDFGCYAVQVKERRSKLLYFMDTNIKSVKYFKGLAALLYEKGFDDVADAFQKIRIGIDFGDVTD